MHGNKLVRSGRRLIQYQSYVELEAEQAATDGNDDPCIAALLQALNS